MSCSSTALQRGGTGRSPSPALYVGTWWDMSGAQCRGRGHGCSAAVGAGIPSPINCPEFCSPIVLAWTCVLHWTWRKESGTKAGTRSPPLCQLCFTQCSGRVGAWALLEGDAHWHSTVVQCSGVVLQHSAELGSALQTPDSTAPAQLSGEHNCSPSSGKPRALQPHSSSCSAHPAAASLLCFSE